MASRRASASFSEASSTSSSARCCDCLGLALSILDLVVDFLLNLLQLRFGIRLRLFAFALNGLVRGLLSLGDPLLDAPARLAVDLLQAGPPALTHLPSVVGAILGLPRGLEGSVLRIPSTLRGIAGALHPNVHRIPADRSGVGHGCAHPPALGRERPPSRIRLRFRPNPLV